MDTEAGAAHLLEVDETPVLPLEQRRAGWRRSSVGAVLGGAVLLAVGAATLPKQPGAPSTSSHLVHRAALSLAENVKAEAKAVEAKAAKKAKDDEDDDEDADEEKEDNDDDDDDEQAPKEDLKCAAKDSEDCSNSKCCADVGYQCYAKSEDWAVCRKACDADEMKKYDPAKEEWSCKELGQRNRCAKAGEECSKFGCCEEAGAVCYAKSEFWSSCMQGCNATAMKENDPKKEDWSCKEIGERNYKSKCTWAGQNCLQSKCCNNNGFTCAVKDEDFAGCTLTTKKSTWFAEEVPIPGGWEGTVLGGGRGEYSVPQVPEGQDIQGASLFCVMVYLPNSTEESLMWLAKKNGVSIFGCNESMTLHSWQSAGAGWDTGEVTLMNTDVFLDAFEKIRVDGRYKNWDWTVKADPDCVFFADRLMGHLWALRAPKYMPIYLKNNGVDAGLGNNGFLGAIEVFSNTAMLTFFDNAEDCRQYLGVDSGEDGFFKACMDALGVAYMTDVNIFTPDYDPAACRNAERVAFHPIKTYKEYQSCVDIVFGVERNPAFGTCDDDDSDVDRWWFKEDARRLSSIGHNRAAKKLLAK